MSVPNHVIYAVKVLKGFHIRHLMNFWLNGYYNYIAESENSGQIDTFVTQQQQLLEA